MSCKGAACKFGKISKVQSGIPGAQDNYGKFQEQSKSFN